MAERAPDASIDRIRDHARAEAARTSLRRVAKAAGVKVGATKKFIDGSVPYERNARAWKRWYARELRDGRAATGDDTLPAADAALVLDLLLWGLPPERRPAALAETVGFLRELYRRHEHEAPAWVRELGPPAG